MSSYSIVAVRKWRSLFSKRQPLILCCQIPTLPVVTDVRSISFASAEGKRWPIEEHRQHYATRRHRRPQRSRRPSEGKHTCGATAVLMDENWEASSSPGGANMQQTKPYQIEHLEKRQQEFLQAIVDYRNFWYDHDPLNTPLNWRQATQFKHPTAPKDNGKTWGALVESEHSFVKICNLCHDLFVATASLSEFDLQPTAVTNSVGPGSAWIRDSNEFLTAILPFWEVLRKERTALVNQYAQPPKNDGKNSILSATNEMSSENSKNKTWMGWFQSILSSEPKNAENNDDWLTNVTAHQDLELGPKDYHYTKLVGRLYFHFPQDSSGDWRHQRAGQIQHIVDQSHLVEREQSVLTDKIIRLCVRSYQDIGTLESAYQAEQIYHRYPEHQTRLLWYVLMAYLNVTDFKKIDTHRHPPSHKAATLATRRVCELISAAHQQETMTNVLQPWATIGLQCLVNIHPANFKSSAISQDEYYKLVHTLCVQKFGPNLWESILSPAMGVDTENMNADIGADNLSPKDGKTLQQLIEIYSQDEEYFERAQQLLETTWRLYPCSDLRQSFKPSAFQSILNTLVRRKRSKLQKKTNEIVNSSEDLNYALQMLDEKMMSDKVWWPDEDTFVCLFRLTDNGPQADQVLAQLELCRAIMREYPLTRAKAAKYALNSWALSAEQGHPGAAERALEILRAMQVESKPLIYFSEPEKVAHLYDPENAPDRIIYTLVLKTCAKSNSKKKSDIALFVHECAKKENISFTASMYTSLLRCILDCEDEERRFALTEEIYNEALAAGRLNSNVLFQLRWANPELYQRHLVEHSVNEDNDQESESDIEHETLSVDGHYK